MSRRFPARILIAAVILAGCSDSSGPASQSEVELTNDIALSSGLAVSRDVAGLRMAGVFGHAGWMAGPPMVFDRPGCPYSAETGWHECSISLTGGPTVTWSYAFFAADRTPQQFFDSLLTASISSRSTFDGTMATDRVTSVMRHARAATVTGLEGRETRRVWNATGTRNDEWASQGDGPQRSHTIVSSDTVANVVQLLPEAEHPWPASGSIVHNLAVTNSQEGRRAPRSGNRRVLVTFNGTQFVPLLVGDRTFTLDLATGQVAGRR